MESIPLPPCCASKPPPSWSRDRDLPYLTLSNLFRWPESSTRPDAQRSPISTLRSQQAGGLGVSHFEARIQTVLGNRAAPDSRCPLCCRVRWFLHTPDLLQSMEKVALWRESWSAWIKEPALQAAGMNQTFSDSKSSDTDLKVTWELEGEIRGPRAHTVPPMSSVALLSQTSPTPSPFSILSLIIRFRAGHPAAGSAASRRGLRPRSPCALGWPQGVATAGPAMWREWFTRADVQTSFSILPLPGHHKRHSLGCWGWKAFSTELHCSQGQEGLEAEGN